jgi:pimeloyl-ACP methyl ester carboxylesterase
MYYSPRRSRGVKEETIASGQLSPQAPNPGDELAALIRLGFRELGAGAAGIGLVERGVAERIFSILGRSAEVGQRVHGTVAAGVSGGLRGASEALGRGTALAMRARTVGSTRAPSTTPLGAALLGAINGLIGDGLEREQSDLRQTMSVRVDGAAVSADRAALGRAFPQSGPKLVVFLHGLMETEFSWQHFAGADGATYGSRLAAELGYTAVYVRYNTGRHVSENGRSLDELLERLVAEWPVEVREIALVGHSMGGLVARSACHQASERGAPWVDRVRQTVTLGTPHLGAPLAQAAHYATAVLGALPETRALAEPLRRRSAGIRDLRQGSLVDEDWRGRDPDALRASACKEVPLLEGPTHCFVAATLTRSDRHPLGRVLGDALVLVPSASGRGRTRRIPFRAEDGAHVGGAHHLALLNHPAVYERLREWLATPDPSSSGPAPGP